MPLVKPDPFGITDVRFQILDTWYYATYNEETALWEGYFVAPGSTSWWEPDHKYKMAVEATNWVGTQKLIDGTEMSTLNLRVLEKVAPTALFTMPTAGSYITNNKPTIRIRVEDEAGGSGINNQSLSFKINGAVIPVGELSQIKVSEQLYTYEYTPLTAYADGEYILEASISDNDGNVSEVTSITFYIDTVPPVLVITNPIEADSATNVRELIVAGTTNDNLANQVKVTMKQVNYEGDIIAEEIAQVPNDDGTFSFAINLEEGLNTITVISEDLAGQRTTVVRTVILDTTVPEVLRAWCEPNPAATQESMGIYIEVR